ncbi:testis-expressed protein 36 [Aplysia californica]|uniref:Testis-expressed protein 36 n=1 Tax=Aplysia californica TaxID=6500 RepID=A0ABM1VUV3_APLCA|nr:testis-expressed protein 36 [Aplysia californica]
MTKGRRAVPSSANEGIWFRHRGEPGDPEGRLRDRTSTRDMLEAPFSAPAKPRSPPQPFRHKEEVIYKTNNPFTQHDNRHYFQEHGVYLGNGRDTRSLGRRLHPVDHRLHHTDHSYLHHRGRNPTTCDYNPVTATSYQNPGPAEPITRRRFPRVYRNAESAMDTTTTDWSNATYHTPLHVLAASQEPFLAHNRWKYSYKGPHKVYPPYDRKKYPHVENVLNRYGANFATVPPVASSD